MSFFFLGVDLLAFPVKQTLVLVLQVSSLELRQNPRSPYWHWLQVRLSTETQVKAQELNVCVVEGNRNRFIQRGICIKSCNK